MFNRWYSVNKFTDHFQLSDYLATMANTLVKFDIPFTKDLLVDALMNHPKPQSLLGLTQAFSILGIKATAIKCSLDNLIKEQMPVIARFNNEQGQLVLIINADNKFIHYIDSKKGKQKLSFDEFGKLYCDIAIILEPIAKTHDTSLLKRIKQERINQAVNYAAWAFLGLGLLSLFIIGLIRAKQPITWLLLEASMLAGIITSIGLLTTKFSPALMMRFCPVGEKVNCMKVLSSTGSKVFGLIPLSDICLIYFSAGFISLILMPLNNQLQYLWFWALIATLSVPVTVWSVYYQAFVLKSWCTFCMVVNGILWLQFLLLVTKLFSVTPLLSAQLVLPILISFLLAAGAWILLNNALQKLFRYKAELPFLSRFFSDPQTIDLMVEHLPKAPITLTEGDLIFGNKDAPIKITVIFEPDCPGCAVEYFQARDLAQAYQDQVCLDFKCMPKITPDAMTKLPEKVKQNMAKTNTRVYLDILAMVQNSQNELAEQALNFWFEQKKDNPFFSYEEWKEHYPEDYSNLEPKVNEIFNSQIELLKQVEIEGTPTFFVNGAKMPMHIHIKNLYYYIASKAG